MECFIQYPYLEILDDDPHRFAKPLKLFGTQKGKKRERKKGVRDTHQPLLTSFQLQASNMPFKIGVDNFIHRRCRRCPAVQREIHHIGTRRK
jgi:hypothetical protein